ncbi:MAG: prolyl oligopeptidase family serine peptidase [Pseudomonadales bacterium]
MTHRSAYYKTVKNACHRLLMICALPTLILFFASGSIAADQADENPLSIFRSADVFDLEWASQPVIAPNGRQIVYARKRMDIMLDKRQSRLWLVNADGTGHQVLTGNDTNESGPAWSPQGDRIAYVGQSAGRANIYVYWLESGKTARLSSLSQTPNALHWSPDGSQLAFTMLAAEKPPVLVKPPEKPKGAEWAEKPRVTSQLKYESDGAGRLTPGFLQVYVLDAIGGSPRQVTQGRYRHLPELSWAADGKSIVFAGNRNADWERAFRNSEVYRVDVASGEITALTDRNGPDSQPIVSPNGKWIAYTGYADKVQAYQLSKIQLMAADGSSKRELLSDFDYSVDAMHWNGNSSGLYFQYDKHGDTKIGFVSLSGKFRAVSDHLGGEAMGRPYGGGSFSVSKNNRIAFSYSTPYRPADVAVVGSSGAPTVVTLLNEDLLGHRTLGKVEELWYSSSFDQRKIQGWIVWPPNYDKDKAYPLLVENHGGPISNYGARFSPEIQLYASADYIVFYPNARGSTGYGETFSNLLFNNYPGEDYQDVMDGVDELIKRGIAQEGNLYVTGGSAGGIMTAWMIGKNNRFRSAAVIKPVMNWVSKTLTADNYFAYADYRYPGQPWENWETYMKFSPVSLVGNIQTPTLVMVGTDDLRTPLSEAKQLYHALKIRDIDTLLVEIPGASHFIAKRPSQLIAKIDHILAWFERYRDDKAVKKSD